jgi:glycosyltransferase involved in cell wall biosynthesis
VALLRRAAKLRVGLAPGVASVALGTGHGTVWRSVLAELRSMPSIKLRERGPVDVWLAPATAPPPDRGPLVVQLHEVGWHEPTLRALLEPAFADHLEALTVAALGAASHVITPSEVARAQVIDAYGWPPERVHAVHHGVDHRLYRPALPGGRELVGAPYVLFVGVLHPRKNLEAVRDAIPGLARRGLPHVLAAVAGPPPDRTEPDDVDARMSLLGLPGRVRLLRGVPDRELAALMAGAEAFCLPSLFEGFGLPALEAMACGTPVVVSDRGALPEVVGDAALIVDPNAGAVEDALARVLTDRSLADRLRRAGIERAAGFHWRKTAEGWLEVLRAAA